MIQFALQLFLLVAIAGDQERASSLAARIDAHYSPAPVLLADFEQRTESGATKVIKSEHGRLIVSRPGRFIRFEYEKPERKVFLYREDTVELYVPADRQLMRYALPSGHGVPYLFLLGRQRLSDCLELDASRERPTTSPSNRVLHLQPVSGGDSAVDFFIEADPKSGAVARIIFFDDLRNRIELHLTSQKSATRQPDGSDRISVPPDVEVIERR